MSILASGGHEVSDSDTVKPDVGKATGKFDIIQYCSGNYSSEMLKADYRKKLEK